MRRGALDRVIDIEHYIITGVSSSNEPIYSWVTFVEDVFAEVYTKRGVELWSEADKKRISETVTRFRIDYTEAEGISAVMRIRFEGQIYDIKAVLPDHDRKQDVVIDAILQSGSVESPSIQVVCEPVLIVAVGEVYQCFIHIIGGTAPYSVTITDGSPAYYLPPGLSLVQAADQVWSIEGYPSLPGLYPISVTVQDSGGAAASIQDFVLVVSGDGSPA